MILLYGISNDDPLDLVADALEERGIEFLLLDQRRYAEIDFIWYVSDGRNEGEIVLNNRSIPLEEFTGIYNRVVDFFAIPGTDKLSHEEKTKYLNMFSVIGSWMETAMTPVLNSVAAMSSNASKPYQLKMISKYFSVPETLITNNPEDLHDFNRRHKTIIYKSASSVRSVVKLWQQQDEMRLHTLRYCPVMFQEALHGINYRVHVVGKKIFATRITSDVVDYRYSNREGGNTKMSTAKLPQKVANKCLALCSELKLPLAGVDLFFTDKKEWYCFEVNPSPGFSYFQKETGQPIADAIVDYFLSSSIPVMPNPPG